MTEPATSPKVPTSAGAALSAVFKEVLGDRKVEPESKQMWRVEAKTGKGRWFIIDIRSRTVSYFRHCVREFDTVADFREGIADVEVWIAENAEEPVHVWTGRGGREYKSDGSKMED